MAMNPNLKNAIFLGLGITLGAGSAIIADNMNDANARNDFRAVSQYQAAINTALTFANGDAERAGQPVLVDANTKFALRRLFSFENEKLTYCQENHGAVASCSTDFDPVMLGAFKYSESRDGANAIKAYFAHQVEVQQCQTGDTYCFGKAADKVVERLQATRGQAYETALAL